MHYFVCFHGILSGVGINRLGEVLKEKPSLELLVGQELFPVPQPPCFLNSGGFVVGKFFKQFFERYFNSKTVTCLITFSAPSELRN